MGQRHCGRRTRIPLVLPAGMKVDIGVAAHHGHGLGPGRTHRDQLGAKRLGHRDRLGRRACPTDHHAQPRRCWRYRYRLVAAQHDIEAGQGDRADLGPAIDRQRDMHRPVSAGLAIFAGAVDRIDDPHPALGQTLGIVLFLFGQEPVFRALFAQGVDQELVGRGVAGLAQRLEAEHPGFAHRQQETARHCGEMGGKFGVGHGRAHFHGISWRMMCSAACSAVISAVLTRISGSSGGS